MPKAATLAVVGHIGPTPRGDGMSAPHALAAFAALGQPTRLTIFQLLMSAEPGGLAAGAIANEVGCPHNTLSSHLSILARSGLVRGARDGRSIIYRANVDAIRTLVGLSMTAATVIPNFAICRTRYTKPSADARQPERTKSGGSRG
jgi:DNA-binding transcriptional ArsR family regulator